MRLVAGALTEPDNFGDIIILKFPTFTKSTENVGISRVLGAYHTQADSIEGLKLGHKVTHEDWKFYQKHVNGDTEIL